MPGKAVGRAAVELPWLCPNTDSLIALAENPATAPDLAVADPALAVFLLRFAQHSPEPAPFDLASGAALSALLPETAAAYLGATTAGVLPQQSLALRQIRAITDRAGHYAAAIARHTHLVPDHAAATAARLSALGWFAVAAFDPLAAANSLTDPRFSGRPAEVQSAIWGLDHAAIVRRLAARWRLPAWVATTIGCLTLPLRVAGPLVACKDLFAVVQLAILEAERDGLRLGLTQGADAVELLEHLKLDAPTLERLLPPFQETVALATGGLDANPHNVPLVRNLLRAAGENRRRNGPGLVSRLENQVDALHRVVAELGEQVGDRLRDAKLAALAELAAGAGHEINNPLAVISGNAQRLLRTEPDDDRGESLRAIVRQTHRIASILRDLMQFARPARPEKRESAICELIDGARVDTAVAAQERGVRVYADDVPLELSLHGDPKQLRQALAAVVQNAIDAAGAGGWVRVSASVGDDESPIMVVVEDSGPGLPPDVASHAFDPFYSGRSAGRGRGLGLSMAWRTLRENGGDLRYDPSEGPTRFILNVRRGDKPEVFSLRSA